MRAMRGKTYDSFFSDTLAIAAELAALRDDPAALGRLVVSLAQVKQEANPDLGTNAGHANHQLVATGE